MAPRAHCQPRQVFKKVYPGEYKDVCGPKDCVRELLPIIKEWMSLNQPPPTNGRIPQPQGEGKPESFPVVGRVFVDDLARRVADEVDAVQPAAMRAAWDADLVGELDADLRERIMVATHYGCDSNLPHSFDDELLTSFFCDKEAFAALAQRVQAIPIGTPLPGPLRERIQFAVTQSHISSYGRRNSPHGRFESPQECIQVVSSQWLLPLSRCQDARLQFDDAHVAEIAQRVQAIPIDTVLPELLRERIQLGCMRWGGLRFDDAHVAEIAQRVRDVPGDAALPELLRERIQFVYDRLSYYNLERTQLAHRRHLKVIFNDAALAQQVDAVPAAVPLPEPLRERSSSLTTTRSDSQTAMKSLSRLSTQKDRTPA